MTDADFQYCTFSAHRTITRPHSMITFHIQKKRNWGIQEYSDINLNTLRKVRQKASQGNWHISLWVASVKWQQYSEIHFTFSEKHTYFYWQVFTVALFH